MEAAVQDGDGELGPIDLCIFANVEVTIRTSWQAGSGPASPEEFDEAVPFTITGPPGVVEFLKQEGASTSSGHLSPPTRVTIQGERARAGGIPAKAMSYAFCYPLETLPGDAYQRLICDKGMAEPWLFFLLLGVSDRTTGTVPSCPFTNSPEVCFVR
jgi:hypothetical protein